MSVPSYRKIAEGNLSEAAHALNMLPNGQVRTDVMMAHAAKAQALATMALAQALIHLGDILAGRDVTEGDQKA